MDGTAKEVWVLSDVDAKDNSLQGRYVSLSMDAKISDVKSNPKNYYIGLAVFGSNDDFSTYTKTKYITSYMSGSALFALTDSTLLNNSWCRAQYVHKVKPFSGMQGSIGNYKKYRYGMIFGTAAINNGASVSVSKFKMEYGKFPTPYTISPSDIRIETVQKGVFYVDETSYNGSIITLKCLDNMSKFDRDYKESNLECYIYII